MGSAEGCVHATTNDPAGSMITDALPPVEAMTKGEETAWPSAWNNLARTPFIKLQEIANLPSGAMAMDGLPFPPPAASGTRKAGPAGVPSARKRRA